MFFGDAKISRLVRRIREGVRREESAAALHALLHPRVERFFRRRGFSTEESRDLTQDVFLRVYTGIEGFAGQSSFETWWQAIALNVYKNEIRRRKAAKRDKVEKSIDDRDPGDDHPFDLEEVAPNPLDRLIDKERHQRVWALVETMPEQMQICFRLRYDHDYKYREIADLMKITVQTVKAHLHQARERLKKQLPDLGNDEPEE
ncbi:MAG TPA: RNA polymerase sigma factor [Thermoanaerobaculia bacterium]|nr:RNA polymerase sigma factor [Thermoanaerobaculia bacterium]